MAKYPLGWVRGRCHDCGGAIEHRDKQTLRCPDCSEQVIAARKKAMYAVERATARGELPYPQRTTCVDCGARAEHYDHRDYRKPLDVQPVCRSCNFNRGPAVWRNYAEAV
jgi:DNA-directed RNA polymerase subunit RPC12/RpoP